MATALQPLEPPPIRTAMNDSDGKPGQIWAKWFQNLQVLLNTASGIFNVAVPLTSTSPGTQGQIVSDANFLYVCVAKNSWKRIPLTAF